ncbi:MAG: CD0415/CD1112 family protein [Oscillospiraceae bacterium]|nr:CD0415/CD1112 family protein [Oscillospiraceae bacterium]
MFGLFDSIANWFRGLLIDGIMSNFTGMFNEVNTKVGEIAAQVGQTPQGWNSSVFSLIRTISETVVIPIAGMILTFILCYELITMIIEKNNMAEFDVFTIYKWIFKTFCAVYILTHTFDIVMGVFSLAQHVVNGSAGIIGNSLNMNLALTDLADQMAAMGTGELLGLYMESAVLSLAMKAISLCIFIIIYGRMIEIYLVCSIAPIPFSTMANREWGHIGNGYLKSLFALAFQGFLIMVCIAIYAILLQSITSSGNIHTAIWGCAGYSILLCFTLFKSSSVSRSIFGAH